MKQKISSYKKLKIENESLRKDIYNLICNADKEKGLCVKRRYQIIYLLEDSVMFGFGNTTRLFDKKQGIADLINNSEKINFRR